MLPPASPSLAIVLASALSLIATAPATPLRTRQDDSFSAKPPKDLALQAQGAQLLVSSAAWAFLAYRKVLDVDTGQSDLAAHVAILLIRQEHYPEAIDVLKDAMKANPKDARPYSQLAVIYARYLKKIDQAIDYVSRHPMARHGRIEIRPVPGARRVSGAE